MGSYNVLIQEFKDNQNMKLKKQEYEVNNDKNRYHKVCEKTESVETSVTPPPSQKNYYCRNQLYIL
jgi:hypothetical protein